MVHGCVCLETHACLSANGWIKIFNLKKLLDENKGGFGLLYCFCVYVRKRTEVPIGFPYDAPQQLQI
jgi:hypothetical protein